MKFNPIIVVSGEPYSIFLELFFKVYSSKLIKTYNRPLILVASKKLILNQMKILGYKFNINLINQNMLNKKILDNQKINLIDVNFNYKNKNNKISFKSKKYIEKYGLTYREIKQKIRIETLWNQLIYTKYNEQVKIDLEKLKKIILKQKENQISYLLSEILFRSETNEDVNKKYELIKKSIESVGFKNSANIYSIADTSKVGGKIGWINENQLSKKIVKELEKLKINEYSKPINLTEGYLILKVGDIKKIKNNKLDVDKELKKLENYERNKQLNKMSNIFFSKIKNNTIINDT